jgi:hypothetical protein
MGTDISLSHRLQTYGATQADADTAWNTRHSAPADAGEPADVEGDIRIAIWNAGMNGGMGQDPTLAFIKRAMAEPAMMRVLATLPTTNQQHPQSNDKEGDCER